MGNMPRWDTLKLLNDSNIEIHYAGNVYKGKLSHTSLYIHILSRNNVCLNHSSLCEELFDDWRYKHCNAFKAFKNSATNGSWPETKDPIGFAIEYMKTYGTGIIYDERTKLEPTLVGDAKTCAGKIDEIKKKENSLDTNIFKQQVKPNYKFTL
jgi:hypothetical protein